MTDEDKLAEVGYVWIYAKLNPRLVKVLAEAREEGRREGFHAGANTHLATCSERFNEGLEAAAKMAERKYSSRVPQEAVGNLIVKRIRTLLEEGKA